MQPRRRVAVPLATSTAFSSKAGPVRFEPRSIVRPIVAVALAVLAMTAEKVHAQSIRRILHVCDCPESMAADERTGLLLALGKRGYVQGKNIDLESHDFTVAGDSFRAYFDRELAAHRTDLVLASGVRAAEGAKGATTQTPVVSWRLSDPIGFGLVASLARPGRNLTGFSRAIEKLAPKRLELLREMLPSARRIGFVFVADNASHQRQAAEVRAAAPSLGLEVRDYALPAAGWTEPELDGLFAHLRRDGVDAFLLPDLNVLPTVLVKLAAKYRLPTIHSLTHVVTDWGGLAAYATEAMPDLSDIADYADRILKGARPGDLPVQEPTRFELVLNARSARALGLTFPPTFLLRASAVVEK